MAERTYIWYIEALDAKTNEVVAKMLGQDAEESFSGDVLIPPDDKRHNLWQCPFSIVSSLFRSKNYLNLRFNIYNREGQGKIRKASVVPRRRRKIARHSRSPKEGCI